MLSETLMATVKSLLVLIPSETLPITGILTICPVMLAEAREALPAIKAGG
jgi:hypothetical protein